MFHKGVRNALITFVIGTLLIFGAFALTREPVVMNLFTPLFILSLVVIFVPTEKSPA